MASPEPRIHPTAVVQPGARLGEGVEVGPHCLIGENVVVGPRTKFEAGVSVLGWTTIGTDNHFSPGSVIGTEPQDIGYQGEPTRVEIGDRNVFREFFTVHRASAKEERLTRIGSDGYFMAYGHVAHDCRVGDRVIFANGATLGGHVSVGDHANLSAFVGVHQFCRIGRYAMIGGYAVLTQDVAPFALVAGQRPPRVYGLNIIGLRRKGFAKERIADLKRMYRLLFFSGLGTSDALARIEAEVGVGEDRDELLGFVRASKRGIVKKTSGPWDKGSD